MNKKSIIEKTVSLDNYLCSVDGYKIYDLMKDVWVDNGYGQKLHRWGASGVVFYTTDDVLVEELEKVRGNGELKEVKEFLLANKDHLHELHVLRANGLNIMNDKQFSAFKHLSNAEVRKDTLKNGYYGAAHLVEDDKILFFYQNNLSIKEYFNNKNLNDQKNYFVAQEALLKEYKDGKIEPDGELTGGARDKVMNALLDINFYKLTNYQKETTLLLKEFSESVLSDAKFSTRLKKGKHIASFTQGQRVITVEIPKEKNADFIVSHDDEINNIRKVANLLYYINKEISQEKVSSFLNRKKI